MKTWYHVYRSEEGYDSDVGGTFESAGIFSTTASALECAGRILESGRAVQIEPDLPHVIDQAAE